ncbi:MAG: FAD binding domain-containing protein [Pseudomonadota bacterium]
MTIRVETYPTLDEAARALGQGGEAAFLAGGTVVMRAVNAGTAPPRLVRTTDPALRDIRVSGEAISLGAGVTMAQVLAEPQLDFLHPVARAIGGPQLRNMGTVGGNLFAEHPYGDFATALLALGARVRMAGAGSSGQRPVDDLLRSRGRASGLVAAIEIARPRPGSFGFAKVSRIKPKGVSILSIAVLAPREGARLRGVRVAYGAMGPGPLRSAAVERVLEGQSLDAATRDRAAAVAPEGLQPPTDALASYWYRREVVGVHLSRLLATMESR